MRFQLIIFLFLLLNAAKAQTNLHMNLLYQWKDSTLASSFAHDNTYNEVWGYEKNGREYAIIGSTAGTHIFDITDINNVDTVSFIPGKVQGGQIIHRDYDTYQDYLYIVCDEGPSSLQIADLSTLPNSVSLVYDDDSLIVRSHNIFIDTASGYLYSCSGLTNFGSNSLSIYSLSADPTQPQHLMNCLNDIQDWNSTVGFSVHDIYVRNDTAWCNAGNNGLFIVDFSNLTNVQLINSMTSYPQQGYNHSGWLNSSGDYYAFADETHGMDVKFVDVSDLSNLVITDTFASDVNQTESIPHNLIFKDNLLYVSYYVDGLYVFNTSDPNNISLAGYYDTSTRLHNNTKYEGNWGLYPLLSSGKIIASDMQEGLFIFETSFPTAINKQEAQNDMAFILYPNPSEEVITVTTTAIQEAIRFSVTDLNGKIIKDGRLTRAQSKINISDLNAGLYTFSIIEKNGQTVSRKFIKK